MLLAVSAALHAQRNVTQFLGIPVDGTKSEMIRKLKDKGFKSTSFDKDILEGEFNGRDVNVSIGTNNNKVYRIFILDANPSNESQIKIRFNNLCSQFENNLRYISMEDQTIPESEDISYEMSVNSKVYEAGFFQKASTDTLGISDMYNRVVWFKITESYGEYRIGMYYDNVYNQADGSEL